MIVVPAAVALILAVLFAAFRKVKPMLIIFTNVPFACVGDMVALTIRGMPVSISAAIGFIVLSGVVVLNGVVLFPLQSVQAGRMSRRIADMTAQLPELRGGALAWRLPTDPTGDEIADLRVALAEAMERLRDARDAQERLIGNAAHELRTPLGLMRTEMDLALRKERSAEELRQALTEARTELDRLSKLAASLLDLAALGRVTWEPSTGDVASVVREAVEACEAQAEARGVVVTTKLPDEALAEFEAQTMRQAIDNLLPMQWRMRREARR